MLHRERERENERERERERERDRGIDTERINGNVVFISFIP